MRARVLTALIGGPLLLAALIAGGQWWAGFVAVVTILSLFEWQRLVKGYVQVRPPTEALLVGGMLPVGAAYVFVEGGPSSPAASVFLIGLFAVTVYTLARATFGSERTPLLSTSTTVLGILYPSGLLAHLILLRGVEPDGLPLALLAVVGTWMTDIGAFFVGRSVGGRKLIPSLSPGKTVAGAIGGWVIGFVAVALGGVFWAALPLGKAMLLALLVPVAAQLGDLFESALKREAKVKDTGRLLPGHGGVLDRFDSLLLVVPVVYYVSLLF